MDSQLASLLVDFEEPLFEIRLSLFHVKLELLASVLGLEQLQVDVGLGVREVTRVLGPLELDLFDLSESLLRLDLQVDDSVPDFSTLCL